MAKSQPQGGVQFMEQPEAAQEPADDDLAPVQAGVEGTGRELLDPDEGAGIRVPAAARQYSNKPDFYNDEVSMPRLRLAQGLTPEVTNGTARPGDWLLGGQEPQKQAVVIPLMFARAMELRAVGDNRTILCSSPDAITGVGDPGGSCSACPMNQWGPPQRGSTKNTPPACTKVFSYVVYSVTHGQVAALEFRRTGTNVAKFINQIAQMQGLGRFGIALGAQVTQNNQGSFYSPQATLAKLGEEEFKAAAAAMSGSSAWGDEGEDEGPPEGIDWDNLGTPPGGEPIDIGQHN